MKTLIDSYYLRRWVLVICWLCQSFVAGAQMSFHHLTTLDGLSHSTVRAIVQDHKGFLWLATGDGLNRYDGQDFTVYRHNPKDIRSLGSNEVTCLLEDRQHRLWVGTNSGGLNRLDSGGARFVRLPGDLATMAIADLAQDSDGTVWAATRGQGLLRIDAATGKVTRITNESSGLPVNAVERLCADGHGNLWLGFVNGTLARLRVAGYAFRLFNLPNPDKKASAKMIMALMKDGKGTIWVGTQGQGLFRYDDRRQAFASAFHDSSAWEGVNIIRSIYEDIRGKLWMGTDDGILVYDPARRAVLQHLRADLNDRRSLSTHAIACIRGDWQGNIWVGTWENGLDVRFAQSEPFTRYVHQPKEPNSLPAPSVAGVAADGQENVWLGSSRGLSHLDCQANVYRHFRHQPGNAHSLAGDDITYLYRANSRAMLVSIWNKGMDVVDPRTGMVSHHLPTLQLSQAALVCNQPEKLWVIGRQSVIGQLDLQTWRFAPLRGIPQTGYTALLETADSTLWIGTFANGLIEWQRPSGRIRSHPGTRKPGFLHDSHIVCLLEDRRGTLWVGTSGGLHRYDKIRRRFDLLATGGGLPNDAIMSITQDRQGYLWVATNGGLCRMDEKGRVTRTYRQADGLPGNDFTPGAAGQSPDGTLFLGGKHGLVAFRPDRIERVRPAFPVYLAGLKLFNRPVVPGDVGAPLGRALAETGTLTLKPDQSVFTLDFGAVLFRAHRNVRYAYRLEPFEEQWNHVGSQRSATYTNLNPGTYRFRVRASLTDGFANAPEAGVTLVVLPPWYRAVWAYGLYAVLVACLLALIRRIIQVRERYRTELRLEQLDAEKARELDRVKSVFFTNISHEFRTPLTLILSPLEQLLATLPADACRTQLRTMNHNANRLLRLINQLLDISKLESGTLRPDIGRHDVMAFVRQVVESFQALSDQQHVTLTVETAMPSYPAFFDTDILDKALCNLLSNALKFTPDGGGVAIRSAIRNTNGGVSLQLTVEDTGTGIPEEHLAHIFDRFYQVAGHDHARKVGSGIGLALTRELVELHKGRIHVASRLGQGTAFTITLPISENAFPVAWLSGREGVPGLLPETAADVPEPGVCPPIPDDDARPLLLLVEDHDDLRYYLADCFRSTYRVLLAADGHEALQLAWQSVPDLVVSDWLMPGMDGVQLCQALKAGQSTSHVPFILLTSRSSVESKMQGFDMGADDYITKPFSVKLLQARVRNLIQSRRMLRNTFARLVYLKPDDIAITTGEEAFLKNVLGHINLHLHDPGFDSGKLEREMGMSTTQLHRKLKSLTGKGGNDLIRTLRLQRATQILEAGDTQVAEVAFAAGFNDPNYFSRVFRKEYGCPPGEYRRRQTTSAAA